MSLFNDDLIENIIQITWRNPAFMAIAIAMVWLIPQLLIRRIMAKNYEESKLTKQKQKIDKLYPSSFKWINDLLFYYLCILISQLINDWKQSLIHRQPNT